MICARSLFIMSVVKPGTGLCCQTPPRSSNNFPRAEIAAPSLPADHCEMAVIRGFASLWARANAGMRKRGSGSSEQTTPCRDWHVKFLPVLKFDVLTASFVLMTVMDFRIANNLE